MGSKRKIERLRRRLRFSANGSAGFTVDISPGGFCAELMKVPIPGTSVNGALELQGERFDYQGTVRWAMAGEPRIGHRGRIGIQFTSISNAFFELYQRHLMKR